MFYKTYRDIVIGIETDSDTLSDTFPEFITPTAEPPAPPAPPTAPTVEAEALPP
jgi:hypothetical protein